MTPSRRNSRGFSLVELMTVVVIVGILAAIAVPTIDETFGSTTARSAAMDVASVFRKARDKAMSRGEVVLLEIASTAGNNVVQLWRSSEKTSLCSQASSGTKFFGIDDGASGESDTWGNDIRIYEEQPNVGFAGDPLCFAPDGRVWNLNNNSAPSACGGAANGEARITIAPKSWTEGNNPVGSENPNDCPETVSDRTDHKQGRNAVDLWEIRISHFGNVKVFQ